MTNLRNSLNYVRKTFDVTLCMYIHNAENSIISSNIEINEGWTVCFYNRQGCISKSAVCKELIASDELKSL